MKCRVCGIEIEHGIVVPVTDEPWNHFSIDIDYICPMCHYIEQKQNEVKKHCQRELW